MVPCAYLRAFEPLDAFPATERDRWGAYVADGAAISPGEAEAHEDRLARTRLLTGRGPLARDAALVRRVGRRIHVCPLDLELRAETALRAFRASIPLEAAAAFDPDGDGRPPAAADPDRHPHIRTAPWSIPLAWFVLFDPGDRHLVDPPEGRGPRLTYLTTAAAAVERMTRAIRIVEETVDDGGEVLAELADASDWAESFDPGAIVELDYGRVASLVTPEELEQDRTCEDLWAAIDSLADGDLLGAAAYYGVARSRWTTLRHRQLAN